MSEEYIFRAKTREAFVIKLLAELLANTLKNSPIFITDKGITLTQPDTKWEQMIDISLHRTNFLNYRCVRPLSFTVTSNHLYRMLKNVKKKDAITMFITEAEPNMIGFCVDQGDETNKTNTTIRINYQRLDQFNLPDGYDDPIIMNVKEFQKIKSLHNIGRHITVSSRPGYIRFFCDGGELWTREVVHDDNTEDKEKPGKLIHQTFNTQYLTGLTKCAGASHTGNVQILAHASLPLKISMKAGTLGDLTIFIKSKEMIEWEHEEEQSNQETAEEVGQEQDQDSEQDD